MRSVHELRVAVGQELSVRLLGGAPHLYNAIRSRPAERPDRHLRRHWGTVLHGAHRHPAI